MIDIVTLRPSPETEATRLVLEHTVPSSFLPDATGGLYVGPGWRWEIAVRESGLATDEQIAASVAVATAQYTTLPEATS